MPPVNKTPKAPIKPKSVLGTAAKMSEGRDILYPEYTVSICCLPKDGKEYDGPITYEIAKKLLKWLTEEEYKKVKIEEIKASGREATKKDERQLEYGDRYMFKNYAGDKVICYNNAKNRPFDLIHAKKLGQDILNKNWEMNCEAIIIGTTGLIISGQHRLIGFMLAVEEWRATKLKGDAIGHWQAIWPEEPVLEAIVAFGCREDPKVIRTIDNVKTRTLSDTIFTSPVFGSLKDANERAECSRMMDFAVDLLWKRTRQANEWDKYQTHSSSLDFLDKHPKIKQCVKHIFDNNRDRVVSKLGLSPGQSAGMMYLMGSSATDSEDYYYPGSPKKESLLTWDNWDKALQFWSDLVDSKNERIGVIRNAIAGLRDPNTGASVPEKVKQMCLAMAWNAYITGEEITEDDVDVTKHLKWSDAKERTLIVEEPIVGGIDVGLVKGNSEEDEVIPSKEEQEAAKAAVKAVRTQKMKDVVKKGTKPAEVDDEENVDEEVEPTGPSEEELEASGEDEEEEVPNPLVEAKKAPATTKAKTPPPFSEAERIALLAKMQPRGANNEKPKPPKKPTLTPR